MNKEETAGREESVFGEEGISEKETNAEKKLRIEFDPQMSEAQGGQMIPEGCEDIMKLNMVLSEAMASRR